MARKILIADSSVTVQKLFYSALAGTEYELYFITDAPQVFTNIFDTMPDLVLANAEFEHIDGCELARLIHTIPCFERLPVALYATNKVVFDQYYRNSTEIAAFEYLSKSNFQVTALELASLADGTDREKSSAPESKNGFSEKGLLLAACDMWRTDNYRNNILQELHRLVASLMEKENGFNTFLSRLLGMVAQLCESPLVALHSIEHNGVHLHYLVADTVAENDTEDFFNVCAMDFERYHPDRNVQNAPRERHSTNVPLADFTVESIPLSSYTCREFLSHTGKNIGTLHVVRSGNYTARQEEALIYLCEQTGLILENSLLIKSKSFYENQIRRAFSKFVPEQIIDDLANDVAAQNVAVGEKRDIAILFSDIRSFTNISEKNKPETIVAFLNRYFTVMVDIIKKYGGTIDKFIGDAIMAEFGAPVSYGDNARRAALAGYEMRKALPDVPLEDLVMPDGMTFNIGIGIHYGDVIVGSLGSKDKTDFTCIGDSVNLASRLEGLSKTYGIQLIISDSMKAEIEKGGNPDGFVFRYLDDVRVKGKKNAVPIYAIDRGIDEFPPEYRDAYQKGLDLYHQGIFRLAKDYFEAAHRAVPDDKAAQLMLERCADFVANPPENWDGAIQFTTK